MSSLLINLTGPAATVLAPLTDPVPSPEDVKPGWIALIVVFLLISVTVALWFNMRKQIGKVKFDEAEDPTVETEGAERRPDSSPNGSGPA